MQTLTDQVYETRQRLGCYDVDMVVLAAAIAKLRAVHESGQVRQPAVKPLPKAKRSRNPLIEALELGGIS
ncbi:MAG: hypothetical protein AAGD09_11495 [Cyanobacteria bacterium P01_F01_bin.56]